MLSYISIQQLKRVIKFQHLSIHSTNMIIQIQMVAKFIQFRQSQQQQAGRLLNFINEQTFSKCLHSNSFLWSVLSSSYLPRPI